MGGLLGELTGAPDGLENAQGWYFDFYTAYYPTIYQAASIPLASRIWLIPERLQIITTLHYR